MMSSTNIYPWEQNTKLGNSWPVPNSRANDTKSRWVRVGKILLYIYSRVCITKELIFYRVLEDVSCLNYVSKYFFNESYDHVKK